MRNIICPSNINTKAKAKRYFRGINFTLISVSTVNCSHASPIYATRISANKGLPLPLDRGVCETGSTNGRPDPENPLFLGFSVLRGGLRPWSESRKGPDHGVGVDPETVRICMHGHAYNHLCF